jgi:hypothetical protein
MAKVNYAAWIEKAAREIERGFQVSSFGHPGGVSERAVERNMAIIANHAPAPTPPAEESK